MFVFFFLSPLVRRLFFGMNEIAVKVPSVFKLLIKEVMLNVVYKKKKLDFLMSFKDSFGPIFKVPLWMENLKTNLINYWLQFINNFYLSIHHRHQT